MQGDAGGFAGGVEARYGGSADDIGLDTAHLVVASQDGMGTGSLVRSTLAMSSANSQIW